MKLIKRISITDSANIYLNTQQSSQICVPKYLEYKTKFRFGHFLNKQRPSKYWLRVCVCVGRFVIYDIAEQIYSNN